MTTTSRASPRSETDKAPEQCLNCAAELDGKYCGGCGQKRFDLGELSVKRFVGQVVDEITDLQSNKILKSFSGLLFKPGLLTAEYTAGRKKRYITPVRLYLTFSAIYFLFAWGTFLDIRGGGSDRMSRSSSVIAIARQRGVDTHMLADRIQQRAERFAGVLRFASVLVSGFFLSLLYLPARKYYVQHLIFSLHYYSFDFLCKSVFALMYVAIAALGWRLPGMVINLFYPIALVYLMLGLRRVYRQSWRWTFVKSLILFACETALFVAVAIAGFIVAFIVT